MGWEGKLKFVEADMVMFSGSVGPWVVVVMMMMVGLTKKSLVFLDGIGGVQVSV